MIKMVGLAVTFAVLSLYYGSKAVEYTKKVLNHSIEDPRSQDEQ